MQGGSASGSLHLPGTYPHDQWQGSRIEGFVIAQGQKITPENVQVCNFEGDLWKDSFTWGKQHHVTLSDSL